jgi:hypothetical protein
MSLRRKFTNALEYFSNLFSTPPQDEAIPARKKPRLQCWIPVGFNFEACQIPDKAALPAIAADADSLNPSGATLV